MCICSPTQPLSPHRLRAVLRARNRTDSVSKSSMLNQGREHHCETLKHSFYNKHSLVLKQKMQDCCINSKVNYNDIFIMAYAHIKLQIAVLSKMYSL